MLGFRSTDNNNKVCTHSMLYHEIIIKEVDLVSSVEGCKNKGAVPARETT